MMQLLKKSKSFSFWLLSQMIVAGHEACKPILIATFRGHSQITKHINIAVCAWWGVGAVHDMRNNYCIHNDERRKEIGS